MLKAAGRELGLEDGDVPSSQGGVSRLNVISACSGCGAESWALKASLDF